MHIITLCTHPRRTWTHRSVLTYNVSNIIVGQPYETIKGLHRPHVYYLYQYQSISNARIDRVFYKCQDPISYPKRNLGILRGNPHVPFQSSFYLNIPFDLFTQKVQNLSPQSQIYIRTTRKNACRSSQRIRQGTYSQSPNLNSQLQSQTNPPTYRAL